MSKEKAIQEKKKWNFSVIWNNPRLRSIFLSACVILVCAVVYVVLLFTVLKPEEEEPLPTIGNHGEQMASGRPFIVDPIEMEQIQGIKVNNSKGGFDFYRGEDDDFYFRGAEHLFYDTVSDWMNTTSSSELDNVLDNLSMVDALFALSRYMLSDQEVIGFNENLAVYGLDGTGKASFTITMLDDDGNEVEKTVYFGNKTVTGNSYYCRVEGRNAVYTIFDNYVTRCVFAGLNSYLNPTVATAISSAKYSDVSKLEIKKKGEMFLSLKALNKEEYTDVGELYTHVFVTPEGYYPSPDNLPKMLETFMNFAGEQVLEYGLTDRMSNPETRDEVLKTLHLYSLMDQDNQWIFELHYEYVDGDKTYDTTLYISEKLQVQSEVEGEEPENIYYVYSPDFDIIVEFKQETLYWVEWDVMTYMDNHTFAVTIDRVSSIEFSYESTNVKYTLQGEGNELKISASTGIEVDTKNFRQLYKAILFTTLDGYAETPTEDNLILNIKITLRDGTSYDYKYYGMTARKAYYSLNGEGQFYINRDYVKQLVYACNGILKGETITVDRKN